VLILVDVAVVVTAVVVKAVVVMSNIGVYVGCEVASKSGVSHAVKAF